VDELAGKPQRVMGFFWFMIGAGIMLDTANLAVGGGVLAVASAVWLWGALIGRRAARTLAPFRGEQR